MKKISGQIVDIENRKVYAGIIEIAGDKIVAINSTTENVPNHFILPGFIDAHVHIESSMLVPTEFARLAVNHGTVATVSDPHEIANVLGLQGVLYMLENARKSPMKFNFGAPSCVPATDFETAGARIDEDEIDQLMSMPEIKYLAEMMNWPGVLYDDPMVKNKIEIAKKHNKPIDGHAPGLINEDADKYIRAGISTDHECFSYNEGLYKLQHGMKVLIREGSAAKNFDALAPLISEHYKNMMFCSDDKHPDSLVEGHINLLIKRALGLDIDLFKILQMACINPIKHYKLDVGILKENDFADFIIVDNLNDFNIKSTFINGICVSENGISKIPHIPVKIINNFEANSIKEEDLIIKSKENIIPVIEVVDGELITNRLDIVPKIMQGNIVSDVDQDILKIVVFNRYNHANPAVAFIKNFNLKNGAIASSVAHDSHNVIAVGVDDKSISKAINLIIENKGGLSACSKDSQQIIPLPIAGLMSDIDGYELSNQYIKIDQMAKEMGSTLLSPFMSLSFMALLVIPTIKLSDKGLFDSGKFEFIDS